MNPYGAAALRSYGSVYFVFFILPSTLLAATQRIENCIPMLLWITGNLVVVFVSGLVIGKINQKARSQSWSLVMIESVLMLLASATAAAFPSLWAESSKDFFVVAGWMTIGGLLPTLLAGLLHKGMLERIAEPNAVNKMPDK